MESDSKQQINFHNYRPSNGAAASYYYEREGDHTRSEKEK